jgi:hypothetical protein
MSVAITGERETEAQTERSRDSLSSSSSSSVLSYPSHTAALVIQAIKTGFHDLFATAVVAEKAAEAATEAQAATSHTPANQHAPLPLIPPSLQQPTATYAYNNIPSVAGRISLPTIHRCDVSVTQPYPYRDLVLASSYETSPRYAERGLPGQDFSPNTTDGGGPEIGYPNPAHR